MTAEQDRTNRRPGARRVKADSSQHLFDAAMSTDPSFREAVNATLKLSDAEVAKELERRGVSGTPPRTPKSPKSKREG